VKTNKNVIALDGDGVLLDYNLAYSKAWQRAFGDKPILQNDQAYWPMDRWGVPRLSGERLERFRAAFDVEFWSTIPPVPGAVQACQLLTSNGYRLVCVTALDVQYVGARAKNLKDLGFPIADVIATGNDASVRSPKSCALAALKAEAFVDDFAPYLVGVDCGIHRALILRDPVGRPNTVEMLRHSHSQHADLLAFAHWWVKNDREASREEWHQ